MIDLLWIITLRDKFFYLWSVKYTVFVTVTDVELTKDLRIARVFVTTMEQNKDERHVFDGLAKASGFVRAELGRRLALRYLPEVIFMKDVSGARADRVLKLLDGLQRDEAKDEVLMESPRTDV